jgi:hypothetical protein
MFLQNSIAAAEKYHKHGIAAESTKLVLTDHPKQLYA